MNGHSIFNYSLYYICVQDEKISKLNNKLVTVYEYTCMFFFFFKECK